MKLGAKAQAIMARENNATEKMNRRRRPRTSVRVPATSDPQSMPIRLMLPTSPPSAAVMFHGSTSISPGKVAP